LVTGKSSVTSKSHGLSVPASQLSQLTVDNSSYAGFAKQRKCPQCNGEVVTKVAIKGKRIGEKFLMCRKYPYCDYRVPMDDQQVIQEMHRDINANKRNSERTGFGDWSN
jgi:ssDNA-binding Zn-finger/Zn-ribbon topoisomerase 1